MKDLEILKIWLGSPLVLVAIIATVLHATDGTISLQFERALVHDQPWRLITANLVHLGWTHLSANLAALMLTWLMFKHEIVAAEWLKAVLICAFGVGIGLFFLSPGIEWYVGLSGVVHGLLVAAALLTLLSRPLVASATLVLITGKLTWEQAIGHGPEISASIGAAVIVDAHLYGAAAGVVSGACLLANRFQSGSLAVNRRRTSYDQAISAR